MKDLVLFQNSEIQGQRQLDGRLWVPVDDLAQALSLDVRSHPLGVRLVDQPATIQSNWGNFVGHMRGGIPYCSALAIFEMAGYPVKRTVKDGLPVFWIGNRR